MDVESSEPEMEKKEDFVKRKKNLIFWCETLKGFFLLHSTKQKLTSFFVTSLTGGGEGERDRSETSFVRGEKDRFGAPFWRTIKMEKKKTKKK